MGKVIDPDIHQRIDDRERMAMVEMADRVTHDAEIAKDDEMCAALGFSPERSHALVDGVIEAR